MVLLNKGLLERGKKIQKRKKTKTVGKPMRNISRFNLCTSLCYIAMSFCKMETNARGVYKRCSSFIEVALKKICSMK